MRLLGCWLLAGSFVLAACEQAPPAAGHSAAPTRLRPEQQLGESGFYVTLPATYALTPVSAPTFVTYNFAPADTLAEAAFTGGICFNCYPLPGRDAGPNADWPSRRWPATVLGQPVAFLVRHGNGRYVLTGRVDSPASGRGPHEQLYVFGEAKSLAGLRQLVTVFASLRRRGPHL